MRDESEKHCRKSGFSCARTSLRGQFTASTTVSRSRKSWQLNSPAGSKPTYSCGPTKTVCSPGLRKPGERNSEARVQWGCNGNNCGNGSAEDEAGIVSAPSTLPGAQGRNRTTDTVI